MPRKEIPHADYLFLNVGVIPQREIDNVNELMPRHLIVFHQANPKWNEKNPEYKRILDLFFGDPLIHNYQSKNKLEKLEVATLLLYDDVFGVLYNRIRQIPNGSGIIIDISGLPTEARAAAQNIAACFDSVRIAYARAQKGDEYNQSKYAAQSNDRSGLLIYIPVPRIDVEALEDATSKYYRALSAAHRACLKYQEECTNRHVAEMLPAQTKPERIGLTMVLRALRDFGLIRMNYQSGQVYYISFTPFGLAMAKALFDSST